MQTDALLGYDSLMNGNRYLANILLSKSLILVDGREIFYFDSKK